MKNPITKAIDLYGGKIGRFAAALGVSYQAVRKWEEAGVPPPRQVLKIVRLLDGAITPYELCPEQYPDPHWMPPKMRDGSEAA